MAWVMHVGPGGGNGGLAPTYATALEAIHALVARLAPNPYRLPGAQPQVAVSVWHTDRTGRRSLVVRVDRGFAVVARDASGKTALSASDLTALRSRLAELGVREMSDPQAVRRVGVGAA